MIRRQSDFCTASLTCSQSSRRPNHQMIPTARISSAANSKYFRYLPNALRLFEKEWCGASLTNLELQPQDMGWRGKATTVYCCRARTSQKPDCEGGLSINTKTGVNGTLLLAYT